ncbi:MAG: flippase-like domain-containing protein [Candidatus Brocadiaceae bacterium]|jgi:hypothetical protein
MIRPKAATALKVLAVLAVLGLLCYVLRRIGFRSIISEIGRTPPPALMSAALLQLAVFVLWAFRMQLLMRPPERRSILSLFPIYMAGVFGNVVTPGARVGGEPIRAYYMSAAYGGEKSAYLGTILADKLGNAAVVVGFLVVSLLVVVVLVPMEALIKAALLTGIALLLVTVVSGALLRKHVNLRSPLLNRLLPAVYHSRLLKFIRRRFRTYGQFEDYAIRKLDNVFSPIARAAGSPRSVLKIVVISGGAWLLFCLLHHVLFLGFGVPIGFPRVIVIVTISTCVGDVSMSPGGAGFMEGAMLALCAAFGITAQTAAAVTLISRGIFYGFALGAGGASLAGLSLIFGRRK